MKSQSVEDWENSKKVKQVMGRLTNLQSKIIIIQETHLAAKEDTRIRQRWRGEVFSAPFSTQSRGVMMLVHKSIPLNVPNIIADKIGRSLIIQGTLYSELLNLVNVYAPNNEYPRFFQEFISYFVITKWSLYNCLLFQLRTRP